MLKEKIRLTYNDYLTLPEEKRYELIEGELFMVPAPDFYHQIVSGNIELPLREFVKKRNQGEKTYHNRKECFRSPRPCNRNPVTLNTGA